MSNDRTDYEPNKKRQVKPLDLTILEKDIKPEG